MQECRMLTGHRVRAHLPMTLATLWGHIPRPPNACQCRVMGPESTIPLVSISLLRILCNLLDTQV